MKNEATKGDPWGVSQAYPGPAPFFLLLLDDLGQAGLRLRRWRWRQGLHPSLALGRGGPLNTRHNAGISVGLLRTAGIRVLAHGCLLPVPCAATPAGARSERAHGRGGTGAQALPGRGPCAQSPCPSRCRGEETRGTGRRQSPRRRLLLLPPLPLVRLPRGVEDRDRGRLRAHGSRGEPRNCSAQGDRNSSAWPPEAQ